MVVEEEPNQAKMVDKRQEEEEEEEVAVVGGAMEGRGLVGRNMRSKEAVNHRRHRHLRLITIISITTITTIMAEQRAARSPSQRHRFVSVCVSMHKILGQSNFFFFISRRNQLKNRFSYFLTYLSLRGTKYCPGL